jgi:hypothetical protein
MDRYEKTLIDSRSCEGIVFNRLFLLKDKTDFFITNRYPRVLSEKIKLYQGDQIFLYDPLPRVLSASGVIMRFKKRLSMERRFRKTLQL